MKGKKNYSVGLRSEIGLTALELASNAPHSCSGFHISAKGRPLRLKVQNHGLRHTEGEHFCDEVSAIHEALVVIAECQNCVSMSKFHGSVG